MTIQIKPNADMAGNSLWFEIPAHLQSIVPAWARSKINKLKDPDLKARYRATIAEAKQRGVKYTSSIPLDHDIALYALYGEWRFGSRIADVNGLIKARLMSELIAFADKQRA